MGLLNPGGPIAQFKRNRCSISPVELILQSGVRTQVERAQEELRRDMDAVGRGKLLRLLDAQNALLAESKLMSFTAGFKLAWGMTKDLEADGLYSFEREEEERICHPAEQED